MVKFLIFAGTTEGRQLVETLLTAASENPEARLEVTACVATDYGRNVLEESTAAMEQRGLRILSGRRSEEEMARMMTEERFDAVIDATHPYAAAASACIRGACQRTAARYIRLLRDSGVEAAEKNALRAIEEAVFVESTEEAVRFLGTTAGPVLLTTGSKELAAFTKLEGYRERLFARVLPMTDVVAHCTELGFQGRQLICMQGPFSYEMNAAMLKQTGARYLVTKDSGKAGGFDEKLLAAEDLGVRPVIIGRKPEKDGESRAQVLFRLEALCGLRLTNSDGGPDTGKKVTISAKDMTSCAADSGNESEIKSKMKLKERAETGANTERRGQMPDDSVPLDWFPIFIKLKDKHITVIGAGAIAGRRIKTLLQFSCRVTVIAKEAAPDIIEAAERGRLKLIQKPYETPDLFDMEEGCAADYVLAATDDRSCNHRIYCDCKVRGIPVNVADCKEENDFYFPGIARRGELVVGITACGRNHTLAKVVSREIRGLLEKLEFRPETKKD